MGEDEQHDGDPAAAAFTKLAGEIALMRGAVERIATEKADTEMPDYSETLGEIVQRLDAIEDKPAMMMTPEDMAARIGKAAETSRRTDAAIIGEARERHRQATNELWSLVGTMRGRHEQRQHLYIAIAAGCLIWSILPGVILRAMPTSWHMPEKMATHIIGEPSLWEAGSRMMRAGNADSWRSTIIAVELWRDNREALEACEKKARKAKKTVRCAVNVGRSRP